MRLRSLLAAALVALALLGLISWQRPDIAVRVGAGLAARVTCSLVLNSGMEPETVFDRYLAHLLGPAHPLVSVKVDRATGIVEARAALVAVARAIHRPGVGCVLVADADETALRRYRDPPRGPTRFQAGAPWPRGDAPVAKAAPPALVSAIDRAFSEPNGADGPQRQTTAVVIAHRGRLVAERYAPGVLPETPLPSWSMAKMVIGSLIGIAVGEGRIAASAPAPVPEWRAAGDPRAALTLEHLLQMSSGLAFDETYGAVNDVSRMLFTHSDAGAFAAAKPLAHPPGSVWAYSSGTSNILARVLRDLFDGDLAAQVRWSRERLFDPVGMRTAFIEADASGSFIGSSFVFASARDWARFGQLQLQDGVWEGRRLLPEGWVRYGTAPVPEAPQGRFGAHWWLNAGDPSDPGRRDWPELPRDTFAARGMSGQYAVVVPSAQLVVVRLGLAHAEGDAFHGIEPLVRTALDALAPSP